LDFFEIYVTRSKKEKNVPKKYKKELRIILEVSAGRQAKGV
jgi:hypothetical protein